MSLTISVGTTELTRTADYVEEHNDDGTVEARVTYKAAAGTSVTLPSVSPRNPYLYYKKHTLQTTETSGGMFDIYRVFFWGVGSSGNLPEDYGELLVGDSRIPIQCHPKFVSDLAGTPSSSSIYEPIWDPDDFTFVKFKEVRANGTLNPLAGVESFEAYQATWRWHYFTSAPDWGQFSLIDKVFSGAPLGGPSTPSGRNWKLSGVSIVKRGYVYEGINDYKLSGPRGWITNPAVYAS